MATLLERIESLRHVGANWDSYGADAPNSETLSAGGRFLQSFVDAFGLPEPYVTPTRIGGLLVLWTIGSHELEIEFEGRGAATLVTYAYENEETGEKVEGEFTLRAGRAPLPFALEAIVKALPFPVAA